MLKLFCAAGTGTEVAVKKKPARARKKAAVKKEPSLSDASFEQVRVTGQDSVKKVAKPRRRKFDNELTVRLLAAAKAALAAPETGRCCLQIVSASGHFMHKCHRARCCLQIVSALVHFMHKCHVTQQVQPKLCLVPFLVAAAKAALRALQSRSMLSQSVSNCMCRFASSAMHKHKLGCVP